MTRLDAWDVGPPPRGLADGVMAGVRRDERRTKARRVLAVGALATLACAASVLVAAAHHRPVDAGGDVVASERMEIEIAPGVLAVMERAAHLAWRGREILQDRGDVSYRVKAGAALALSTPAGRMTGGASSSRVLVDASSTYVLVRDGELSVAAAGQRAALGAGRYARVSLASLTVDRDDVDGSIGRVLGVAAHAPSGEAPRPSEPVGAPAASTRAATPWPRGARPSASASSAPPPSAPPPPRKPPIVPPCFCNPVQSVCDCGGG